MFHRVVSSRFGQLGRNAGWLTASRAIRLLASLLVLGAIGRYLGPEQFGQLNFAIGLATIFAAVANLGFEGVVIRELVLAPEAAARILGTAFLLRLAGGILAITLVAAAALSTGDPVTLKLAVIVSLSFFPGAGDVIELWFQKNIDARSTFLARVAATILISVIRVSFIWCGASLTAFAWSQFIEAALGFAGLAIVFRCRGGGRLLSWRWDSAIARKVLALTWPLIFSGVLVAIYARVEQLLVKAVLGDYTLGVYYASIRISEAWTFLPPVLLMTIYPILVAKRETTSREIFQQRLQTVFDVLTGAGFLIAIGATLTAPFLIPLLFGAKYTGAIPILIVQAWTAPILFSGAARAQYFLLENLNAYHLISAGVGIVASVALGLWGMRLLGAPGAALTALVAGWISACGTSLVFPKLRACGQLQMRAFFLPFRIRSVIQELRSLA